jgi:uncharacterized membrane protein
MDYNERANLEGPPRGVSQEAKPRDAGTPPQQPGAPTAVGGFDFNMPTIVALLYLSSLAFGLTAIAGVVLAYIQKGDAAGRPERGWEASHYQYLITTFWIGFLGILVGVLTIVVLVGFVILPAAAVLVVVRSIMSIIAAQKREPMPNPATWFV